MIAPFLWTVDGVMRPVRPRAAAQQFVVGRTYSLEVQEPRSSAQHKYYFSAIAEAWRNLPEALAEEYPDSETLRKKALIRTGYRDERSIVCASKAEARRVAAFIEPMDRYAIVTVSEAVVRVYTARSQSVRAMGRAEFGESVEKVLAFCANIIGVSGGELDRNAEQAA